MPVYNTVKYLEKAVLSILAQTESDFELIIFDDCSTDGSREKLVEYASNDSRIKLIQNEKNQGLIANLNQGLTLANGEYIARMDSDDFSFPERLNIQMEYLKSHPDVVLVGSGYYTIDENDKRYKKTIQGKSDAECFWISTFKSLIMHPSAMFRASTIKENNLIYDQNMYPAEDFDLWSRMSAYGKQAVIQEPLIEYRVRSDNISNTLSEPQMLKSIKVAEANIKREFPEFYHLNTDSVKRFLEFIYPVTPTTHEELSAANVCFTELLKQTLKKHNFPHSREVELRSIAARWLMIGVKASHQNKIVSMLKISGYWPAILREFINYLKRRGV